MTDRRVVHYAGMLCGHRHAIPLTSTHWKDVTCQKCWAKRRR